MKVIERKSQESVVWKAVSGAESGKDRTKFRLYEEDARRSVKNIEKLTDDSLWRSNTLLTDQYKNEGKLLLQEDVILKAKETQTKGRREEKGLQISMGRHVNRVPPIFAQTAAQTDRIALHLRVKEMYRTYRAPIMFYFTAVMISFISVYSSFLLVKFIKGPPPVMLPDPPPSFWRKIINIMHNCRHCPLHR